MLDAVYGEGKSADLFYDLTGDGLSDRYDVQALLQLMDVEEANSASIVRLLRDAGLLGSDSNQSNGSVHHEEISIDWDHYQPYSAGWTHTQQTSAEI